MSKEAEAIQAALERYKAVLDKPLGRCRDCREREEREAQQQLQRDVAAALQRGAA